MFTFLFLFNMIKLAQPQLTPKGILKQNTASIEMKRNVVSTEMKRNAVSTETRPPLCANILIFFNQVDVAIS